MTTHCSIALCRSTQSSINGWASKRRRQWAHCLRRIRKCVDLCQNADPRTKRLCLCLFRIHSPKTVSFFLFRMLSRTTARWAFCPLRSFKNMLIAVRPVSQRRNAVRSQKVWTTSRRCVGEEVNSVSVVFEIPSPTRFAWRSTRRQKTPSCGTLNCSKLQH